MVGGLVSGGGFEAAAWTGEVDESVVMVAASEAPRLVLPAADGGVAGNPVTGRFHGFGDRGGEAGHVGAADAQSATGPHAG